MQSNTLRRLLLVTVLAALTATACAKREPLEYRSDLEVRPGTGLFSGDKGGLVLIGD